MMSDRKNFIIVVAVLLPLLIVWSLIYNMISQSLLVEKTHQLFGIAQLLEKQYNDKNKQNIELQAELIAKGYPGVGVGYYSLESDAVAVYAPAAEMGMYIGKKVSADSIIRKVMASGVPEAGFEKGLRTDVIIAVQPVIRGMKIIGCVFAAEPAAWFAAKLELIKWKIGILLGIAFVAIIVLNEVAPKICDYIDQKREKIFY